ANWASGKKKESDLEAVRLWSTCQLAVASFSGVLASWPDGQLAGSHQIFLRFSTTCCSRATFASSFATLSASVGRRGSCELGSEEAGSAAAAWTSIGPAKRWA